MNPQGLFRPDMIELTKVFSKFPEIEEALIYGSRAKGNFKKGSDVDVAVIVESEYIKKEIIPLLETVKRRNIRHIDYHVFTRSEFLEMLHAEYENLGKQIYKNSIIFYGFIPYCRLIRIKKNE